MNPVTQSKHTTILPVLIALTLACLLSPQARATCQEGCLANDNTVLGDDALVNNTTGIENTAIGFQALTFNTTGGDNTATGQGALNANTTGSENTADGVGALADNTTGNRNTASGSFALFSNTGGNRNTAAGFQALFSNTTGSDNTAIGFNALLNNTNGNNNIALGSNAGVNLAFDSDNIAIGHAGVAGQSNTIRIGTRGTHNATFIAGISGAPAAGGVEVIIGSNGKLGTILSSERFKDKIQPMARSSEAILALRPVTFRYRQEIDPEGIPQFGLVAEEVEKVNPDLVAHDEQGKPYTVRYEAVNAMLLNEFLKEHRKVEQLQATVAQEQKGFEAKLAKQEEQIEKLTAGLQKVSARLELSKSAPRTVQNNQ